MVSKKLIVNNASGLHARPAGVLAQAAGKCSSDVKIYVGERKIEAKSILNIMAAAIKKGTEIEIQCIGPDEEKDMDKLVELIESGLGE
ncbi:MAG: HPr family phosphocarrier protein [Lachnospiraceae bacterium]|nr:HPr family phosphocarrier protein [Lachnospiraceae bacterium]